MKTEPRAIPGQKPYYDWNDLTDQVSLHNGERWIIFDRSSLIADEAKLRVVRQLLEDVGINKEQIWLLLRSLDSANGVTADPA